MSTTTASSATATTWNLDPAHSSAEFKVRHMMISNVKGSLRGLKGALTFKEADPARSSVQGSVEVNTISTGDDQRDAHLKSADFFDAAKFPAITFQSTVIEQTGAGEYKVTGDMTMHGVTKPVTFTVEGAGAPAKDPWGNLRLGYTATTRISRKDFGLTWNAGLETGGVLVGDEVAITVDVEFVKA